MMRRAEIAVVVAVLLAATSCGDDKFTRLAPRLEITAYQEDGVTFYVAVDDVAKVIDLGEVPVFALKNAIFNLANPTAKPLTVSYVTYASSVGERWLAPTVSPAPTTERFTSTAEVDFDIPAGGSAHLVIPYAPVLEGDHTATLTIASDAANGKTMTVTVNAHAVFTGAPDLEVEYNGFVGPAATDCVDVDGDGRVDGCAIPIANPLNFGNIGLGAEGTARLVLRNTAACSPFAGIDPCELCQINIAKDPTRQNLGIDFKPGTNDAGLFNFEGSTATPFAVKQRNIDCSESGEVRLLLKFHAPTTEAEYRTTIVVESNDPDEPLIEIPVVASARNAPIAVAKFKAFNPANPSDTQWTDPTHIEPLTRVYFDGRSSYDPRDPANPSLIATYHWDVVTMPLGTDRGMFQEQGVNAALYSFWLPLAGHYEVKLTVWNVDGIESGDTESARLEFDVVPGSRLHVQLVWDNSTNDQDLHLTFKDQDDRVCNSPWDCHWKNKRPVWFTSSPAASGPNPSLDIDDTNGLGPENINIDEPQPGTYRIYVHYYGDYTASGATPTRNTVRIYLNGIDAAEYRRTLTTENKIWAVADVTWRSDGTGIVTPYPSDAAGEVGSVSTMSTCTSPGFDFP
ncbi:MAG: DUF2135 domain-containing protein [Deltaproteobacteria bacterium]|nr:DUF2135 domain-containing protein [Deltaproteobacteria bacterium]